MSSWRTMLQPKSSTLCYVHAGSHTHVRAHRTSSDPSAERDMEANNLGGGVRALLHAGGAYGAGSVWGLGGEDGAGSVCGLGGEVLASSRQRLASVPRCAPWAIAERDKEANNRGGGVRAGGEVSRQCSASCPRCAPRVSVTNSARPSASQPGARARKGPSAFITCDL
jgi:hypothetical protein